VFEGRIFHEGVQVAALSIAITWFWESLAHVHINEGQDVGCPTTECNSFFCSQAWLHLNSSWRGDNYFKLRNFQMFRRVVSIAATALGIIVFMATPEGWGVTGRGDPSE